MYFDLSSMLNLFYVLKNYHLQFTSTVPDGLKCTICKNVLIDSCFSSCRCKYCLSCIEDYLKTGDKKCPGRKRECLNTLLRLSANIVMDNAGNIEVSYLSVKCPYKGCDFKCELRKLPEHMGVCLKASIECMINSNGNVDKATEEIEGMKENTADVTTTSQTILLMKYVKDLQKEFDDRLIGFDQRMKQLDSDLDTTKTVAHTAVEESAALKIDMDTQTASLKTLTDENVKINYCLRKKTSEEATLMTRLEEIDQRQLTGDARLDIFRRQVDEHRKKSTRGEQDIRDQIKVLQDGHDELKLTVADAIGQIAEDRKKNESENMELKQQISALSTQIKDVEATLKSQIEQLKYEISRLTQLNSSTVAGPTPAKRKLQDDSSLSSPSLMVSTSSAVGTITSETTTAPLPVIETPEPLEPPPKPKPKHHSFEWRIEQVSSKLKNYTGECSLDFYSDAPTEGYRLRLEYLMNKQTGLYLAFRILRGPYDEYLRWPMRRPVQMDIIDQRTGQPVLSKQFSLTTVSERRHASKTAYDKPRKDENNYVDGLLYCMTYAQVATTSGAICDDSILVRCRVMPTPKSMADSNGL